MRTDELRKLRVEAGRKGGKAGTGHAYAHGKVDPRVNGAKGGALGRRGYKLTGYIDGVPQYVKKV